jgi:hypothetical protein
MRTVWKGVFAAAFLVFAGGPAFADVIDGDWCSSDGRHMSIRGADIITPAGNELAGLYSRHSFSYVVPTSEPYPGETVHMQLLNPDTVALWVGTGQADSPETWKRCTPISGLAFPVVG